MAKLKLQRRDVTSGPLTVVAEIDECDRLHSVRLPARIPDGLDATHLASVVRQLNRHELAVTDPPPFQRKVWEKLRRIPWGETATYGGMARELGNPRAARAVGQACAANRLALVVPCHRVRAAHGGGGFAWGLHWKTKLLELESAARSQGFRNIGLAGSPPDAR
jgi:O-6-methylguanine DNA methyltransferase